MALIQHGPADEEHRSSFEAQGRRTIVENARVLAALSMVMADSTIGCWDTKYTYGYWRPLTAMRDLTDDQNPNTTSDATWMPLFTTPGHPE
jgi:hypothetical protein